MNFIERLCLKFILRRLEGKIRDDFFEITLSRRIDAIRFLLEMNNV